MAGLVLESDNLLLSHIHVAREMAQGLRALVALPGGPSSVPSPHVGQLTRSGGFNTISWPWKASLHMVRAHTYTHIHRNKNKIVKSYSWCMALIVSKVNIMVALSNFLGYAEDLVD